jgi:phosphate-selective porin OprO/OprP
MKHLQGIDMSYLIRLAIALSVALGVTSPAAVAGSNLLPLLQVLRDNGAITASQYEQLRSQTESAPQSAGADCRPEASVARPAGQTTTTLAAAPEAQRASTPPKPSPVETTTADTGPTVETEGGLSIETADDAFAFQLGGNLWVDGAIYNADKTPLGNGLELRRGRLKLEGRLFHDWGYQAEYDFAGNEAEVKDAYLAYEGFDNLTIKLGQFKVPFSLEEQTSGSNITFMERALPVEAFSPGRKLGVGLMSGDKHWSAAAGLFGEQIGDDASDEGDSGWSAAARGTYAPIDSQGRLVHLGASIDYHDTNADAEVRYRTRPETRVADQRLVDTDDITDVTDTLRWGFEAAGALGPVSLQGEYIQAQAARRSQRPDLAFGGWYLFGSWILTGEDRRYDAKQGRFEGVDPDGPYGAWEVALRYSRVDLNDAEILGGKQNDVTLGINWYLNENLRFMANYIWVDADPNKDGENDRPSVFQFRAQLDF